VPDDSPVALGERPACSVTHSARRPLLAQRDRKSEPYGTAPEVSL